MLLLLGTWKEIILGWERRGSFRLDFLGKTMAVRGFWLGKKFFARLMDYIGNFGWKRNISSSRKSLSCFGNGPKYYFPWNSYIFLAISQRKFWRLSNRSVLSLISHPWIFHQSNLFSFHKIGSNFLLMTAIVMLFDLKLKLKKNDFPKFTFNLKSSECFVYSKKLLSKKPCLEIRVFVINKTTNIFIF